MSRVVSIRDAALIDLQQAWNWYESHRVGLGDEFLVAVADALEDLEQSADRQPVYYRGFRRVMTERFPYKLFYRIDRDFVIVFRVLHAARDHTRPLED